MAEAENKQSTNVKKDTSIKTSQHNGPKRFLLFDNLIVDIVDYDQEDGAPIVEFSLSRDEKEEAKLPVECGICPEVMHRKHLEAHIETHVKYVNGVKRFACICCEEHFASRLFAASHLRRHEGIRPYVCEQCKVYYCTKQDLKMHHRRRHARQKICEICGKEFAEHSALKFHILNTHEQPQRRFACEHCGKQFLRKYAMNEHIRNVHMSNRRLLDCTLCDKVFSDSHKLAQHRKLEHLNQSSYECRVCGLEFKTIDYFDGHRRSLQCREKYRQNKEAIEQLVIEEQVAPEEDGISNQTVFITDVDKHVELEGDDEVLYEIAVEEITDMR